MILQISMKRMSWKGHNVCKTRMCYIIDGEVINQIKNEDSCFIRILLGG